MQVLHHSVILKWELSKKAKLSVFKSIFDSILTYGHETWVMTERVQPQMQASEIRTLYVEVRGKRPVGQHKQDGLNISRILVGMVWNFIQAKCNLCWWIERCGSLIWSYFALAEILQGTLIKIENYRVSKSQIDLHI